MGNGERWVDVEDFPEYEISDHGNVYSKKTGRPLTLSRTQAGIVKVNFYGPDGLATRAVRVLVAEAFVDAPADEYTRSFDLEVVNIDGNQENNHYTNLAWRPHWFAWKYTRQFNQGPLPEYNVYLLNTQTGVIYDSVMAAGIADAVLWEYVYASAIDGRPVYPTGAIYEFVAPGTVSSILQGL